MPTGKVKWYDSDKGYGLPRPRRRRWEVFVHSSALPSGTDRAPSGAARGVGVAEGRRGGAGAPGAGARAAAHRRGVAKQASQEAGRDDRPVVEDLIKLLDDVSNTYRRGKQPDPKDAKKIAAVLRAVADDIDP